MYSFCLYFIIVHIVFFKFETAAVAKEAQEKLLAMDGKIEGMTSIEAGLDFTRSDRSFDLGLITRHESRQALEVYRTHPVHLEVVDFIKPRAKASAAVDFDDAV